jgi:tetratricopeptide (TPR) repeat protein
MLNNSTKDRLLSYLDGELTPDEAQLFEAEIAQSQELKEALQQLKITQYGVKYLGIQNQVKTLHHEYLATTTQQTSTIGKKKPNWLIYVASAAAAAVLVFFILTTKSTTVSADDLYASNYRKYDISNTRGTTSSNLKQQFTKQQYQDIITQFINTTAPSIEDQFFAALSYKELKQFNNSISLLQSIIETNKKQNSILYKDDAEYYLGMIYLQQKDIVKAMQIFEPIAQNKQHLYSDVIDTRFINSLKKLTK